MTAAVSSAETSRRWATRWSTESARRPPVATARAPRAATATNADVGDVHLRLEPGRRRLPRGVAGQPAGPRCERYDDGEPAPRGGQHPRWPREGAHGDEQGAEGKANRQLADEVRPEPSGTRDLDGLRTERLRGQRHPGGRTGQQGGPSRDRAGVPEQEEGAGDQKREGSDGHLRPLEQGVAHGVPGQRHLDLQVHVKLPDLAPHLVAQDVAPTDARSVGSADHLGHPGALDLEDLVAVLQRRAAVGLEHHQGVVPPALAEDRRGAGDHGAVRGRHARPEREPDQRPHPGRHDQGQPASAAHLALMVALVRVRRTPCRRAG